MTTRRSFKIYVAGPIQGPDLLHSLANLEAGQSFTAKVFQLGFAPFPVFTDAAFIQKVRPVPPIQDVYNYSLTWLKAADAVIVMPKWEHSRGCQAEIKEAEKNGIPTFFDLVDLCAWADKQIIPTAESNIDEILAKGDD
jgi:hypothetical protein